jgi:riboflavin kinase / FMN adenylyltransferase
VYDGAKGFKDDPVHHFRGLEPLPQDQRGAAVALGNFDGVHFGHRAIFDAARAAGRPLGVVTFEPHPRSVLGTPDQPFRLTSAAGKARALADVGVELLVEIPFDTEFSCLPPEQFVQKVLVEAVGAAHVVIGFDFRFGAKRAGTPDTLKALGAAYGFGVTVVAEVQADNGASFSSTAIRTHLREGRPLEAARMLGRWWEIDGVVQAGHQRGRTIGFPTANLTLGNLLEPALGVYAVRCSISGGSIGEGNDLRWYDAIANLGRRPTVDGETLLLEVHVFDFAGDLYDKPMRVQLTGFIRPERKFDSFQLLRDQIAADCDTARAMLATTPIDPN